MTEVTMTVRQIVDLGLWDKVCDYKGWNSWILNEGRIDENEDVTFDSKLRKEEVRSSRHDLAEFLHRKLCTRNHLDGCGWYYSENDWSEFEHQRYLKMAFKMLDMGFDIKDIKKIINITKQH